MVSQERILVPRCLYLYLHYKYLHSLCIVKHVQGIALKCMYVVKVNGQDMKLVVLVCHNLVHDNYYN